MSGTMADCRRAGGNAIISIAAYTDDGNLNVGLRRKYSIHEPIYSKRSANQTKRGEGWGSTSDKDSRAPVEAQEASYVSDRMGGK